MFEVAEGESEMVFRALTTLSRQSFNVERLNARSYTYILHPYTISNNWMLWHEDNLRERHNHALLSVYPPEVDKKIPDNASELIPRAWGPAGAVDARNRKSRRAWHIDRPNMIDLLEGVEIVRNFACIVGSKGSKRRVIVFVRITWCALKTCMLSHKWETKTCGLSQTAEKCFTLSLNNIIRRGAWDGPCRSRFACRAIARVRDFSDTWWKPPEVGGNPCVSRWVHLL